MYGATLGVIADWIQALRLPVQLLQPRGVDAHESGLTVRMVQQALRCRRIFVVGGGLEGYLPALHKAIRPRGIPIVELAHPQEEHEHRSPYRHAPANLHIWLDVAHSLKSCERILAWADADGLTDSQVRQGWRRTQLRFRQLQVAIDRLRPLVAGKAYVAVHDAYHLLTRALSMRSLGSLQPDEETPPNLLKLRQIILRARSERVLFVLSHTEKGIGLNLARLLKVPLVLADTLERVDPHRDYFERFHDMLASLEAGARYKGV